MELDFILKTNLLNRHIARYMLQFHMQGYLALMTINAVPEQLAKMVRHFHDFFIPLNFGIHAN
ncbi:hypothetical protein D3C84_929390 [compost metagenome]